MSEPDLFRRCQAYRGDNPGKRMVEVAEALGVSEGALVAAHGGANAVRLAVDPRRFLDAMPALGEVMVLTRNAAMVHEKIGAFDHVGHFGHMGQVVNHHVDLRVFYRHWVHLFAYRLDRTDGPLHGFQVFDAQGSAVHKIYLRPAGNADAYHRLVEELRGANQSPTFQTTSPHERPPAPDSAPTDRDTLRERWRRLQDTHEFFPLLRDLGLTKRQAYGLASDEELARPIAVDAFERALRQAADEAIPIMIFVGNPGCIQIHTGPIHRVQALGPWLNVLDDTFNLHAHRPGIAEAWLVRKPTRDGIVTSIELFDALGAELALLFGERKPGRTELESWRTLAEAVADSTAGPRDVGEEPTHVHPNQGETNP
jgi:putative hemin transport protein